MNTSEYFKHARNLGAFKADDCLALAREAAELDRAAEAKKNAPPTVAWYETLHDGSCAVRLSSGITVY